MTKTIAIIALLALVAWLTAVNFNVGDSPQQSLDTSSRNNSELSDASENAQRENPDSAVRSDNVLDLSGTGLLQTPDYVFGRLDVQELNVSNNNLGNALQAEVRQLQNLRVLNLSNNNFTGVPAEIGQLNKLEILDLSNNQLTGLPYELGNLSSVQVLDLRGNSYSQPDLDVIKNTLSSTVDIKTD